MDQVSEADFNLQPHVDPPQGASSHRLRSYKSPVQHGACRHQGGQSCVETLLVIGPESDHWECLSLTHSLTHSCLVNLIDVTLAREDANSKLVEVVTVDDIDDEDRDSNSLLQIWKLRFDHKT